MLAAARGRLLAPALGGLLATEVQLGEMNFCEKWSKRGTEGVVGTRGPPTVPTTPVFVRLLHFGQKLVFAARGKVKIMKRGAIAVLVNGEMRIG